MTQDEYGHAYRSGFIRTVRLLRCRGASMDLAEDVAQSAWLQGWSKLAQLRDQGLIVSWINTIAINIHRRHGRLESRFQELDESKTYGSLGVDSASLDIEKVLKTCPPQDRSLFEQQLRGLTAKEIADRQGISAVAARLRFLRARRAVRARLENEAMELQHSFHMSAASATA